MLIPPPKVTLPPAWFNDLHNVIVVPTSATKRLLEPSRRKRTDGNRLSHHSGTRRLLRAHLGELWGLVEQWRLTVLCLRIERWMLAMLWVRAADGDLTVRELLTEPRMLAVWCLRTPKWIRAVRGLLPGPSRLYIARWWRIVVSLPHLRYAAPV